MLPLMNRSGQVPRGGRDSPGDANVGVGRNDKSLRAIHYKELNLERPWQSFDIAHELTNTGIQKFVADYRSTLRRPA